MNTRGAQCLIYLNRVLVRSPDDRRDREGIRRELASHRGRTPSQRRVAFAGALLLMLVGFAVLPAVQVRRIKKERACAVPNAAVFTDPGSSLEDGHRSPWLRLLAVPRLFVPKLNWTKENVGTHSAPRPFLPQGLPANECAAE